MTGKQSLAALCFAVLFVLGGLWCLLPLVFGALYHCAAAPSAIIVGLGVFLLVLAFVITVPARASEALATAKILIPFGRDDHI